MRERWKAVRGYEGLYEVSNMGRVRSLDRITLRRDIQGILRQWKYKGRLLRRNINEDGYYKVGLSKVTSKNFLVHRLVLESFIGPRPPGKESIHKDGNYQNAKLSNLRWGTHMENMHDKVRHGTSNRKLTDSQIKGIRSSFGRCADLAKQFKICVSYVYAIKNRETRDGTR